MLNLWKQDGRNNNRWSKKLYKLYCKLLFKDNRNFKKIRGFLMDNGKIYKIDF